MIDFDNLDDIEDDSPELNDLEDLFIDLDIDTPTSKQLYEMYGIFLEDFEKNPILIKGRPITFNTDKSRHPLCRNKYKGFEHIITRKSGMANKRVFDRERANKIHWIRPIIENSHDERILYFEELNDEGDNHLYYWYEEMSYVVILKEIKPECFLLTGFSVDDSYRKRLMDSFENYQN